MIAPHNLTPVTVVRRKFEANITKHLTSGLTGWLFGTFSQTGISLPATFDLPGIFIFLAQLFSLTYDGLRAKLVKKLGGMGEKIVDAFESGSKFMKALFSKGPMALWGEVKDSLGNIKALLFDSVIGWLKEKIVVQAMIKLVSFFNPVGAIVQAVQAIYNVAMFFKERWEQIKSFGQSVFASMSKIAKGAVGAASGFIEQALGKAIPVMISFLARLLNIGGIVKKVKDVIGKVKKPVDKAVNKVIGGLAKMAKKGWKKLKGKFGKDKKRKKPKNEKEKKQMVNAGLRALEAEEDKVDKDKDNKLTEEKAQGIAKKIKKDHPVFSSMKAVDGGDRWNYEYTASPKKIEERKKKKNHKPM